MFKKKEKPQENAAPQAQKVKKDRVPKNVLESIPCKWAYKSGIIQDYDGRFSKTYRIADVNFDTEEEEQQEKMVISYERLLNSIEDDMIGQLTIINRSIDQDYIRNSILMKPKDDGLNNLRNEWNDVFLDKLSEGKNNLKKDKLFTVSVKASGIQAATDILKRVDHDIAKNIRRINHQETPPLSIQERLEVLYDIYNCGSPLAFSKRIEPLMKTNDITKEKELDLDLMAKHGMSFKELIAPDYMEFKPSWFRLGDELVGKAFYLDHLPTQLSTSILNDISDLPCNMITSVTFIKMDTDKTRELIKGQLNGMNTQINQVQVEAAKQGIIDSSSVSIELQHARDQAAELMTDILKRNQSMFRVTGIIILLGKDLEELNYQVAQLKSIVSGHLCLLRSMGNQEETAFNTALPLAQMHVEAVRLLTTESSSVFIPFAVQDMNQLDGIYYGVNPLSHNMIRYNRKSGANYNAVVLGVSGSGKSYIVKEEIAQVRLNTNDYIIIIDPEGEYTPLAEKFGASVIDIALDSKNHINPLDMELQAAGDGGDPISAKCDTIETLVEAMVGGSAMLSPIEKSIIHRVGRKIYRGYYNHMMDMARNGSTITCDKAAMPTLQDFYAALCKEPEAQAQYMATAIESYCVGNYAIFAERTNVDTNNRMIVYNVSNMTAGMKELAMHVCMQDAWNHIIQNGRNGIYTRLYIDEFHLFTKTRTSVASMKNIYKRARKWRGMPTAITQNVSDMFINEEAEAIMNNSSFVIMMNQSPMDRATLQNMYSISSSLLEHIADQPPGNGLIYNGNTLVPLEGDFPTTTEMHQLMVSKVKVV